MPDRNFSRIQAGESERKFGEAPILGRVSRTPGSATGSGGKRRRTMRRKTRVNLAVLAWTLLISFVLLSLLALFLYGYFKRKAEAAAEATAFEETARDFSGAFSDQKTVGIPAIGEAEALAIVRAAFANDDPQAMGRHFILGTDPGEAMAALAGITRKEGEITAASWLGQKYAHGKVIGEVATQTQSGDDRFNRLAQLVIGADGIWRIDLDSYLRRSVPDWETILSGKSETSVVRVFVAPDTYYNGIYSDETVWQAYTLASPDVESVLYGYAKRNSPQDMSLRKILDAGGEIHRATLDIRANPGAAPRQFEITGVPAENWVLGETRFDASL